MSEVTLRARLEGVEDVTSGFERMGKGAEEMGRKVETSARDLVVGFSGVATSAFSMYNAYDRVNDMQLTLDRANLKVKSSLNAVEDAQTRYNKALEKYGEDSEEAKAALKDLQLAQERYQLATENAEKTQGDLNQTIMSSALTLIPSLITAADSSIKMLKSLADATWLVTIAEKARAIAHAIAHALSGPAGWVILAAAAAAAVAGIVLASRIPSKQLGGPIYETGPFLLHAGEYVVPRGVSPITINIYGATSPRETGDAVVYALRRAGVV